jgi:hypothetical protein
MELSSTISGNSKRTGIILNMVNSGVINLGTVVNLG